MGLKPTTACPVCGGARRAPAPEGMARRKDSGRHYLEHAAARLGLGLEQLVDAARVQRCARCGTAYCDPWLDAETASELFTAASPDHIAGWGTFEHWLSSDRPNRRQADTRRLWELLETRIGPVRSYAEFGCPFQGLLLEFRGREMSPARRVGLFAQALRRPADPRWTGSARLHHAASRLANGLAVLYHRLRGLKERVDRAMTPRGVTEPYGEEMPPPNPLESGPGRRLLLTQDTVRAWGNNCVRYGGSCRYFASRVLGADVLPFAEEGSSGRPRLDLLGIFNSLDHSADPLGVIRRGLGLAAHLVIVTHHESRAGKQHQYAFGDGFPIWLAGELPDASVADLTPELCGPDVRENNYLLISRGR